MSEVSGRAGSGGNPGGRAVWDAGEIRPPGDTRSGSRSRMDRISDGEPGGMKARKGEIFCQIIHGPAKCLTGNLQLI